MTKSELDLESVVKTAQNKLNLLPSNSLMNNIIRLSDGLKNKGMERQAKQLVEKFLSFKKAEALDTDLIEEAHPDGSVKTDEDPESTVETIIDVHEDMEEVAEKAAKGKEACNRIVRDCLMVLAQQGNANELREECRSIIVNSFNNYAVKISQANSYLSSGVANKTDDLFIVCDSLKRMENNVLTLVKKVNSTPNENLNDRTIDFLKNSLPAPGRFMDGFGGLIQVIDNLPFSDGAQRKKNVEEKNAAKLGKVRGMLNDGYKSALNGIFASLSKIRAFDSVDPAVKAQEAKNTQFHLEEGGLVAPQTTAIPEAPAGLFVVAPPTPPQVTAPQTATVPSAAPAAVSERSTQNPQKVSMIATRNRIMQNKKKVLVSLHKLNQNPDQNKAVIDQVYDNLDAMDDQIAVLNKRIAELN